MYRLNEKNKKIVLEMNEILNESFQGLCIEDLQLLCGKHFRFPIYYNSEAMVHDITDLELSVRSYNCLKRAGITSIGTLVRRISSEEDLLRVRGLGKGSAKEIMFTLFTYQFANLSKEKKRPYLIKVLSANGICV